jgi:hypothetical protein
LIVLVIQQVIVALKGITDKVVDGLAVFEGVLAAFERDEVLDCLLF